MPYEIEGCMTRQSLKAKPRNSSCFSSPTVLLQLILHEFMSIGESVFMIKSLLPELVQPSAPTLPRKKNQPVLIKIGEQLRSLLASTDDRVLDHPWTPPKGSLSKLRIYLALLVLVMKDHQFVQKLNDEVTKTWYLAKIAAENISHPELMKLMQSIERLVRLVPPLLDSFSHNENIIYFLARYHEAFDQLFGSDFTNRLFRKWHPQGTGGMQTLLLTRYRERRFTHLIPTIKALMAEIAL